MAPLVLKIRGHLFPIDALLLFIFETVLRISFDFLKKKNTLVFQGRLSEHSGFIARTFRITPYRC